MKASTITRANAVIPPDQRLTTLFSHCTLKIKVGTHNHVLIGRGSTELAKTLHRFSSYPETPCLAEIGPFCESAGQVDILLGGEHANEKAFNNSLNAFPMHKNALKQSGGWAGESRTRGPIRIGGNVTFSRRVTVLSGVTIGAGAVIGAGALVTEDIPPFAIAVGTPAKVIGYRFEEADRNKLLELAWWDADPMWVLDHLDALNQAPADIDFVALGKPPAPKSQPYILLDLVASGSLQFIGIEDKGKTTPASKLPQAFLKHIAQLAAPKDERITVLSDPFALL